jgi:hypothetical protein
MPIARADGRCPSLRYVTPSGILIVLGFELKGCRAVAGKHILRFSSKTKLYRRPERAKHISPSKPCRASPIETMSPIETGTNHIIP